MEALKDFSWIRQLSLYAKERFELRGFHIALVAVPATETHHDGRFRYRLLAMDPILGRPVLAVDLESDILGDYCLSVELAEGRRVLARYDELPKLEDFRTAALAEAERTLPRGGGAGRGGAGPAKRSPRKAGPRSSR
ncbi:MAG: hypothetical protein M0Z80_14075 [Treponema sp.]|nr:hypothetical protein [Treponema sp.]